MKFHVGTLNPAKLRAVEMAAKAMFPQEEIEVIGQPVNSLVRDQPMDDKETIAGALNRARAVKDLHPASNYWIGIEGGLQEINGIYFESGIFSDNIEGWVV